MDPTAIARREVPLDTIPRSRDTYTRLVPSCRNTQGHNLDSINKNAAYMSDWVLLYGCYNADAEHVYFSC